MVNKIKRDIIVLIFFSILMGVLCYIIYNKDPIIINNGDNNIVINKINKKISIENSCNEKECIEDNRIVKLTRNEYSKILKIYNDSNYKSIENDLKIILLEILNDENRELADINLDDIIKNKLSVGDISISYIDNYTPGSKYDIVIKKISKKLTLVRTEYCNYTDCEPIETEYNIKLTEKEYKRVLKIYNDKKFNNYKKSLVIALSYISRGEEKFDNYTTYRYIGDLYLKDIL